MNVPVIRKWVEALRSGLYKQGTTVLKILPTGQRKLTRFCCLGVLCDLYEQETGNKLDWQSEHFCEKNWLGVCESSLGGVTTITLPDVVRNWAGLSNNDPYVYLTKTEKEIAGGSTETLAELNDAGVKFKSIARAIEVTFLNEADSGMLSQSQYDN
ncbi:hypothetical protein LCGC14_1608420 [marine sediment metagenome]|uniref:Uncharacterized protein n=1 Tax=marine sediment metagenome TaxID=412755 RepID=A0A0F9KPY3_9ZZZZ